jgi:hypothetical protein
MRTKVTLVLVFLNVALFFFIFKFERHWRTEAASQESRRRVLGPEAADIRTLGITGTALPAPVRLERRRDTWFMTEPFEWPANPHSAGGIVNELQLLEHEASFAVADLAQNKQSLGDFGLAQPRLTVAFASGDPAAPGTPAAATTLQIGDTTRDGKRLYILSPDRLRIHVVDRSLLDSLTVPADKLRADTLLTVRVFEARSLSLQAANLDPARGGAAGVRVRIRRDGTRWVFDAPISARAAKTAVELAINELNALHPVAFEPAARPATLPSAAPLLRVTLEGNNRLETLFIGEAVPVAAGSAAPAPLHYAQLEGRAALFTVAVPPLLVDGTARSLLDVLANAPETLREKRLLDFDAAAVTAVTLAAPILPDLPPLTLQRADAPPDAPREAEPPWQVVQRGDGARGPQTLPAEPAAVRALLERLALLAADQFKSDAPTGADLEDWGFNRPLREITLAFAGNTPPLVLRLGTDSARKVYARVGTADNPGLSIYGVAADIVDEFPLTTGAWRSRTLGEPLPPAARIAALKLTDLADGKPVAEVAFTATGEPTVPPRDPAAVTAVVAALRLLRAKAFLPGGFTERIYAGGEERPWRYRLEAVVALPGGAGVETTRPLVLDLTERLGGARQFAGSRELDTVFALEQPFVDALWTLVYGARDPGPPQP